MAHGWTSPPGRSYHPAYTPSAGRQTELGTSTLAVGNPSSRPRWSPMHDLAADLVRAAEHPGRQLDLAAGEGPADGRAADRLLDPVGPRDEAHGIDDEVVIDAVRLEQAHVALAVAAEVEVLSDDDDLDGEAGDQHPLDERSGDSFDCASSKCSTTVPSSPVAASSSRRCSGDVSSCGADSGRTIVAGWRSNVEHDRPGTLPLRRAA